MLIFKPLHRVHDYYQYSNLIYLAVAFGLIIGRQVKCISVAKSIYITLAIFLINVLTFNAIYSSYKFNKVNSENNVNLNISKYIKDHTADSDVVLVFGRDWSSEIPYYSQRRAVMVPDWYFARKGKEETQEIEYIVKNWSLFTDSNYKAMVSCAHYAGNLKLETLFQSNSKVAMHDCVVYIR